MASSAPFCVGMPVEASAPLTGKSMPILITLSDAVCVVAEDEAAAVASLWEVDVELFDEHPVPINPSPSTSSPEHTARKRIASLQLLSPLGIRRGGRLPFPVRVRSDTLDPDRGFCRNPFLCASHQQ